MRDVQPLLRDGADQEHRHRRGLGDGQVDRQEQLVPGEDHADQRGGDQAGRHHGHDDLGDLPEPVQQIAKDCGEAVKTKFEKVADEEATKLKLGSTHPLRKAVTLYGNDAWGCVYQTTAKGNKAGYLALSQGDRVYYDDSQKNDPDIKHRNAVIKRLKEITDSVNKDFASKRVKVVDNYGSAGYLGEFVLEFDEELAWDLWEVFNDGVVYGESGGYDPSEQSGLGPAKAKETIGTLCASIISSEGKVTQATLNTLANLINNNGLLQAWSNGFQAVKFKLGRDNQTSDFGFVPPKPGINNDFLTRFITGKETFNGFLHRSPEIVVTVSPSFFKRLKERNDLFKTCKAAIEYYDRGMEKVSKTMMAEIFAAGEVMKNLIATTKLRGVVYTPLMILLMPEQVNPSSPKFTPSAEVVATIKRFVRMVVRSPQADKTEQAKIITDLREALDKLMRGQEYTELTALSKDLPDGVQVLCEGGYDGDVKRISNRWLTEQCEAKVFLEAPKVKRLKKIPSDLVAYITIEGEAIRDANDKMMIVSYAYGKLEIIEWYLELLEVGSRRYIVPHSKEYLVGVKTQILSAIKRIMDRPIPKPGDPIISINYPKGYEG